MYVIISPDAHLQTGGWPVCLPIGTNQRSTLLDTELQKGEGGVQKTCYVWGNEIFTLNPTYFRQKMGSLPSHARIDIQDGLREFFQLHQP